MRKSEGALACESKARIVDWTYSDLESGVAAIQQQFYWLGEQEVMNLVGRYVKRWRRFYGLNNKYDGNGNLR